MEIRYWDLDTKIGIHKNIYRKLDTQSSNVDAIIDFLWKVFDWQLKTEIGTYTNPGKLNSWKNTSKLEC